MEKEISTGASLGITLIALAAIIGIGFGIFAIAKNTANEGTTNVQDSLSTVSESTFDDYNQKTVTGSAVKSCMTTLADKSYAILVNTQAANNGQKTQLAHKQVVSFLSQGVYAKGDKNKNTPITAPFVVYNALLSVTGEQAIGDPVAAKGTLSVTPENSLGYKDASTTQLSDSVHIIFENGTYITNLNFQMSNGNVQFDTKTGSSNMSGDCLQIADNSKFRANLLKDESGIIRGVVFEQIAKN